MTVRVLVVDDQRVVRDGLAVLLGLLPDIEVVGSVEDGEQALGAVARFLPDVVLMDLRMPRMDGIEATRRLRADHPAVAVLALTTYADDESVVGALRAGARGYLTKDAGADEIARAIAVVASGQMVLDTAAQLRVVESLGGRPEGARTPDVRSLPDDLTEREAEVLGLIAEGLSNAEIAARLVVSQATVKTHVNHIFAKTGARDRAQAVAYAYRTGLAAH
ncbi:two component transcriptional regulator, LuxR family [Geodermatophilus amargosae]|uniref:Two component transcriptional regulator, LuxR family n=1 Tax=Geodermatophilus amargosae TaxID=1296565 RepID=A0A1I7CVL7_9ACTN|nr:response regulator transcription factor [Geodermatophilus amargosae]SFU03480.1 two component transcriptional regulator, LuxR family [Geodermatophilus amargosae]